MSEMQSGGNGELAFTVWPAYLGLVNANLGTPPFSVSEPSNDPVYKRGQIYWEYRSVDGLPDRILGRARIIVPAGEYTHFAFFHHPTDMRVAGLRKLDHPIRYYEEENAVDVDPIYNEDLQLNTMERI
jgi:hypothetical protein